MHIHSENVKRSKAGHIVVEVTQGQKVIESFARSLELDQEEISLRFSGARFGNDAYLVVGVRKQGRGFDILLADAMWHYFVEEINTFTVAAAEKEDPTIMLTLDWDEEAFQAFLDQCQQRFEDDPNLEVMGKIVHFFS